MSKISTILNKRWKFYVNKKIDLLLLDDNYVEFKFSNLKYHLLFNEIYIYESLKALILFLFYLKANKLSLYEIYLKIIISKFDPKIAIGHDKNGKIFLFKKLFPNKISVAYQFGYIFENYLSKEYKKISNKKVDYYFVFDERSKDLLKKIITSKYIISGSVKANERCDWNKKRNMIYDVMFISSFRPLKKEYKDFKLVKYYNDHDIFFIKTISNFCKKNKLKFCIAFSSLRRDKISRDFFKEEKNYMESVSNNFLTTYLDSYSLAEKTNLCIGTFSNLAYELLLSKKKVNVFYKNKKVGLQFLNKNNSNFVFYSKNRAQVENRIKSLLKISHTQWKKKNNNFFKYNKYDYKNIRLKKLIINELKN